MPSYILFDTETTGNQSEDRIIQVGAMVFSPKEPVAIYNELCSTSQPISVEAMEVHNIVPEMIANKPPFSQSDFLQCITSLNHEENYLIAHNIAFDLGMLTKEGFASRLQLIDTLRCSKHLFPDMEYHRLQYLRYALELYRNEKEEAQKFGIEIKAHDALGDVLILKLLMSELVRRCKEDFPDDDAMVKLVELTNTPVMMRLFKFGKYRGELIEEIAQSDPGYLQWMRTNLELDEDLAYTLDNYITH